MRPPARVAGATLAALLPVLIALASAAGCDRAPRTSSASSDDNGNAGAASSSSSATSADGRPSLRLATVAPLLPARETHLAVDRMGNILWTQEADLRGGGGGGGGNDDASNDIVYMLGEGAVPQATHLTAAHVLGALNRPDGTGNIQSIAAAPDGGIFFYFSGGKGAEILACIGWFEPRSGEIRILCDAAPIQKASGMVASLALARGKLMAPPPPVIASPRGPGSSSQMWLWLRHSDGSALLRFSSRPLPSGADAKLKLTRPFRAITAGGHELTVAGENCRIGVAADNSLAMVDVLNGALWRIDTSDGSAELRWSLVGLPRQMSYPAMANEGTTMVFAADSAPIKERSTAQIAEVVVRTTYPALLLFSASGVDAIARDHIRAYAGFPVYRLELTEWAAVPPPGKGWITYDRSSGELMRATLE